METIINKCGRCNKIFYTKYYNGGSINHDNWTNDDNLGCLFNQGIDYMIKKIDMRADNVCNIKSYSVEDQKCIVNCVTIWLKQNGYVAEADKVTKYFEDKEVLFNTIINNNSEIKKMMYYAIEYNTIIDFYNDNDLKNKQYKFITIKNMDKTIDAKQFLGVELDGEIYTLLNKSF